MLTLKLFSAMNILHSRFSLEYFLDGMKEIRRPHRWSRCYLDHRLAFAPVIMALTVLRVFLYSITKKKFEEIQAEFRKRSNGETGLRSDEGKR